MSPNESEWLTPEEAAVYWSLNVQTIYRRLRARQVPGAVKLGSGPCARWRIPRASVLGIGRLWEPGTPPPPASPRHDYSMGAAELAALLGAK